MNCLDSYMLVVIVGMALFVSTIRPRRQKRWPSWSDRFRCWIHGWVLKLLKVPLTEHVVGTAGDHVPAEIEYRDTKGNVLGFWAYGYWHPLSPYKGQYNAKEQK